MKITRQFAMDTTRWIVWRILSDFREHLPLGVNEALYNVLDVIGKERNRD